MTRSAARQFIITTELEELYVMREQLLRSYAAVLHRVGANHPHRGAENKRRAARRKQIRHAVRRNAEAIAVYCAAFVDPHRARSIIVVDTDADDMFRQQQQQQQQTAPSPLTPPPE